ncbi:protein GAMETE EXPRESSED 2 isoform X2 [Syzygium oleosum]|uniref:protein GAMETE EXPRESSED 2 isoform X2 n=1 Tax=Syzygium oleosum TaxID=219896 RepID=UPI0024BAB6EC|nr:protein GAMETE EXPRESSED 2 isoform X2 [Syzygium oleosum]
MAFRSKYSSLLMAAAVALSSLLTAFSSQPQGRGLPSFAFSWSNDNNTFRAGDAATINVKVLDGVMSRDNATSLEASGFRPSLTVNGKTGNSSYVSGVLLEFGGDPSNWRIVFTPIMAGLFNVIVTENNFKVMDSSLHFQVVPGPAYASVFPVSWLGLVHEFVAGTKAALLVLPKDAFGNNISSSDMPLDSYNFTISSLYANNSVASTPNISSLSWNEFGYITIEFTASMAGNLSLQVLGRGQNLNGSPLPFQVNPGPLDVSSCLAKWKSNTTAWQIFSKVEISIYQLDLSGNLISGLYAFDVDVVENGTNMSIPIADLHFEEVALGIQLFSFSAIEVGNFWLRIFDAKHGKSIANMPYSFTVFTGYCDASKSVVNGSGLNSSMAGGIEEFSVYLNDLFQYPSPVEVDMVRVQIGREFDSYTLWPHIYPVQLINVSRVRRFGVMSQIAAAPGPSVDLTNHSGGSSNVRASAFNVVYAPDKSGIYDVYVYCGNVLLNNGHPIKKEVRAGEVNMSVSGVVKYDAKVPKLINNEVVVRLMDTFYNPIVSQHARLKLEIISTNSSGSSSWDFTDNNDGSYTVYYVAPDVGTYEMSAALDGNRFASSPLRINVYGSEYFPKAYEDAVSVWEDESFAIDVLANDYFAGNNATIIYFSQPGHGSLLQYGQLLRYTPYKDYYGNDTFLYTISDVNGNNATAYVSIGVLKIPPQFASFPTQLQATEDMTCPKFGGYSGLRITYADFTENISVSLSARFGTVSLSPMLMEFWQGGISVSRDSGEAKELILQGRVEAVNSALESFQYLGNQNFSGEDTIRASARNANGKNDLDIPVVVEPINDSPFFKVPEFVILKFNDDEALIFDRKRDKFDFFAGDPDLLHFPGGGSLFLVEFSVEVSNGFLVTSLPAELINSTELKLRISYQWQPLQTYVAISKHFKVKAAGIRFRGRVEDCNNVMQQLVYHGREHGAVLTLSLNDLGNYGCYPDCAEMSSLPLYTEASVNLIRRNPINPLLAHSLGSAIIIEFVLMSYLGVALLYFSCKCAILLVNERRPSELRNPSLTDVHEVQNQNPSSHSSENANHFSGHQSSCLFLSGQPSYFRQLSRRISHGEASTRDAHYSRSASDHSRGTPQGSYIPFSIEKGYRDAV